jgi:hypothetical protein
MRLLIRPKTAQANNSLVLGPSSIVVKHRPMRVLDFDLENRPLSYLGQDFTTSEITAIAWAWTDEPHDMTCLLLGEIEPIDMLRRFVEAFDRSDMVTGHFITGHDLPLINGSLMEHGLAPLSDKMRQDTKVDLIRSKGISLSQESLGAMFRLEQQKIQMNQAKWRAANRLTPEGRDEVRKRVVGDVQQHIQLRKELLERDYLKPPRVWRSGSSMPEYQP